MYRFNTHSFKNVTKNTTFIARMLGLVTIATACLMATPALAADEIKGDASKAKVAMCIGCHGIPGYKASFPEVYSVPMIAGQNAQYIETSLQAYAKGDRSHPTMNAIAGSLSAQDMADLAAYYSNFK